MFDDRCADPLVRLSAIASLRSLIVGLANMKQPSLLRIQEAAMASNLIVFDLSRRKTRAETPMTCLKLRQTLQSNYRRFYPDAIESYEDFSSMMGGSRFIRNTQDVRLIDSVYRTRDKRSDQGRQKHWDEHDALWQWLDSIG